MADFFFKKEREGERERERPGLGEVGSDEARRLRSPGHGEGRVSVLELEV